MWNCPNCNRTFSRVGQPHSCKTVAIEYHFRNKAQAKDIFDSLLVLIRDKIGACTVISLPCCIHLASNYDFFAALPKKDGLEIRFSLHQALKKPKDYTSSARISFII